MKLEIRNDPNPPLACKAVIIVPEKALDEAGRIRCLATDRTGQSKHEFHALGQMALMRYEDGDLPASRIEGDVSVITDDTVIEVRAGVVICRLHSGALSILSKTGRPVRKHLETANRFCTRWVRLDI